MASLSQLLRSLGNDGAVTNVHNVLEERARQEWVVAGLALRVEREAAARTAARIQTEQRQEAAV